MNWKMMALASAGLVSLSACGVYQDYPNDKTAVESYRGNTTHTGYYGHNHYSGTHPYARQGMYVDNTNSDVVVGQDPQSYMEQNDDKWMYNSCPPGAAKRGDC
jgi:hypothetical protein